MCGIAAVIASEEDVIRSVLPGIVCAMGHRGPDAAGAKIFNHGSAYCGLGSTRLRILDLSPTGAQPMVCPRTGATLVYNGEIYNFRELRAELESRGRTFQGNSDTEVLLQGLVQWGPAVLPRLAGMFAFAFVDGKRERLLLARDPLGIKPLYMAVCRDRLVVASEVRAVLHGLGMSPTIDQQATASFLAYGAVPQPHTIFKEIRAFPAGNSMEVPLTAISDSTVPDAHPYYRFPQIESATLADALPRVREILELAVREHLISDVPLGIFLSSGVDSSIIATLAAQYMRNLRSFTVAFHNHRDLGEHTLAEKTARRLGLQHTNIFLSEVDAQTSAEAWLDTQDQPSMDGLNVFVLSKAVRAHGIVVALSGQGGDELFGGYPSFKDVPRMAQIYRRLRSIPAPLRAALSRAAFAMRPLAVRDKAADAMRTDGSVFSLYLQRRRTLSNRQLASLGLNAGDCGLIPDYLPPESSGFEQDELLASEAVSVLETHYYLGNMLLRDTDATSMAHSLEVRVPFLDTRVVNAALSLPASIRFPHGAPDKFVLRQAFPEALFGDLAMQGKRGFTLPIQRWMTGVLRERCEAGLNSLKSAGFLQSRGVDAVWSEFLREPESPAWTRAWSLCVLGIFIDQQPRQSTK
jgi:asparagine synthase (glutamine-hydrolysing)